MCRIQNIPFYDHHRTIMRILKQMNLDNWKDKKIQQLSGGMQRRVSIAMTMINSQTKLIIMDEPSTGLDPQTKRIIWLMQKISQGVHEKHQQLRARLQKEQRFTECEPISLVQSSQATT
ncbi:ABC_transporter family protein [Hexamita inflata]|uniref:ABC_transporter family protein n=1 Tax=Hexamita inflata TaxID=28002 RepID=A0ABP1I9U8_9EUKA